MTGKDISADRTDRTAKEETMESTAEEEAVESTENDAAVESTVEGDENESTGTDGLLAYECADGHLTYPAHTRCPDCGQPQTGTVDLSGRDGEVITWTSVSASPTGVRAPNTLAIVEFTIGDRSVRAIGQTIGDVTVGETVRPVHVESLRDPDAGIRVGESQSWDGYRFEPVD